MGDDKSGTLAALKANRRELIDPKTAEYGGRSVKTTGDGFLLDFASVVPAAGYLARSTHKGKRTTCGGEIS